MRQITLPVASGRRWKPLVIVDARTGLRVDVLKTQPCSSPALQTEMKRLSCSAGVESTICHDLAPAGVGKVALSKTLAEAIDLKKKNHNNKKIPWRCTAGESGGEEAKIALATAVV